MAKAYNTNWSVKELTINFNQKQWRQDFGAYVRDKLYWYGIVRVSRAKADKGPDLYSKIKGAKTFEVYNDVGGAVVVHFQNNNEIIGSTHEELLQQYFQERGLK